MQQREQLILKKLAEAREGQASAMTRFIQTRARAMQVEARLQALRSRLAIPQTVASQAAGTDLLPTNVAYLPDILPSDTPLRAEHTSRPASADQAPSAELPLLIPETPALNTEQSISEQATVMLNLEQSASQATISEQAGESNDDEDTKKQRAIQLTRPSAPSTRQNLDEDEMLLSVPSALVGTEQPDQVGQQAVEGTSIIPDTSATDITAKIPVIRRERRKQQESE